MTTTTTTLYRGTDALTITVDGAFATVNDRGLDYTISAYDVSDLIDGHLDCGWIRALTVATLEGGDHNHDHTDKALWLDLGGRYWWLALVADREAAQELAHNTGARLLRTDEWDNLGFGDEDVLAIESSEPGVITLEGGGPVESGFRCELPEGWSWGGE
jgi:hypothetical protein